MEVLGETGTLTDGRADAGPGDETVCAALGRYEATLRDAMREIRADVGAFKAGVEQRLEEAGRASGPLGRAVAQLQQENRQLRGQLEALTRQLEALTGPVCDGGVLGNGGGHRADPPHGGPRSPAGSPASGPGPAPALSPTATRFSSRATFALFSKTSVSTA